MLAVTLSCSLKFFFNRCVRRFARAGDPVPTQSSQCDVNNDDGARVHTLSYRPLPLACRINAYSRPPKIGRSVVTIVPDTSTSVNMPNYVRRFAIHHIVLPLRRGNKSLRQQRRHYKRFRTFFCPTMRGRP